MKRARDPEFIAEPQQLNDEVPADKLKAYIVSKLSRRIDAADKVIGVALAETDGQRLKATRNGFNAAKYVLETLLKSVSGELEEDIESGKVSGKVLLIDSKEAADYLMRTKFDPEGQPS